jgi:KUP system potassium uptake protein
MRVAMTEPAVGAEAPARPRLLPLALGALGVVFGDIGTSPLYAFRECLRGPHGVTPTPAHVLGVLSLIFWALTLVVTVKYLTFIMRCDNHGEGGAFALLSQLPDPYADCAGGPQRRRALLFVVLGVTGAALLYGDGIVTPAISVLSAVEGLELAAPGMRPLVVPITCATLVALFAIQSRGTGHIGKLFGPIMLVWFVVIGVLGALHTAAHPAVLSAFSPRYAVAYFQENGVHGALILGAVVLAVTGGEALYADMGHFGVRPIRLAWFSIVMPALFLAYLGQGALVLENPAASDNPFFAMVHPGWQTYTMVALASASTVVASQALISGVFSLTKQAIQLGYLPRLTIRQTAWETEGQIYVPAVNWALAVSCIALVLGFRESTRLASAYGIAVSGTMALTSLVFFEVQRTHWKWPLRRTLPILLLFLALDLPFVAANAYKVLDGGYVPVVVATMLVVIMLVWKRGQRLFTDQLKEEFEPLREFIDGNVDKLVARVPGSGVYLARDPEVVPPALKKLVKAIPALQETVLVLSLKVQHVPAVAEEEQLQITDLGRGFFLLRAQAGFMQQLDVPELVERAAQKAGLTIDLAETTYYLRRETFLASSKGKMGRLSEGLFSLLARNARPLDAYFRIPPSQVFEVGAQFDL